MALFGNRTQGRQGSGAGTSFVPESTDDLERFIAQTGSDAGQGQRGQAREERQAGLAAGLRADQGLFNVTGQEFADQQGQLREDFLRQRGQTEAGFSPFIQAGEGAIAGLERGSTAGGLNEILAELIGGGQFQALQDIQRREAQGQLSASGLGGSGLGVEQLSQIGPRLALQLAGDLRGRQSELAQFGFQGVERRGAQGNQLFGTQGQLSSGLTRQLGGLREGLANRRFAGLTGRGEASARTREDQLAADAQKRADIFGTVGTIAGAGLGNIGEIRDIFS